MRWLNITFVVLLFGCGAAAVAPEPPTPDGPESSPATGDSDVPTQARLAERVLQAMSSCEARARCCPDLDEPLEVCEANMEPFRSMMRNVIDGSSLRAAGAALFDAAAIAALEADVAACRPLVPGDAFLNSLIVGTLPAGESCGQGNAIDAAACRTGLECLVDDDSTQLTCSPPPRPIRRPPPTMQSTYCRPFE